MEASLVQTISSIGLLGLTAILAWYTRILAAEARKTREMYKQPLVVVTIEPGSKESLYMNLVIENVGMGLARNIRIQAEPDFEVIASSPNATFNNYTFLKLDVLKPGQAVTHSLGTFKDLKEIRAVVVSRYDDIDGKTHLFSSFLDATVFRGLAYTSPTHEQKLIKSISAIEEHLKKISKMTDTCNRTSS